MTPPHSVPPSWATCVSLLVAISSACSPDFDTLKRGTSQGSQAGALGDGSQAGADTSGGGAISLPDGGASSGGTANDTSEGGSPEASAGEAGTSQSGASAGGAAGGQPAMAGTAGNVAQGGQAHAGGGQSGAGSGGQGGQGGKSPVLRFDFETTTEGFQKVGSPVPLDCLDTVESSTEQAHHGLASLALRFDGLYTEPALGAQLAFGVDTTPLVVPPPGAALTLWVYATATGAQIRGFALDAPDAPSPYQWHDLASALLPAGQWMQIRVPMPNTKLWRFGFRIDPTSPAFKGTIYVDEISW